MVHALQHNASWLWLLKRAGGALPGSVFPKRTAELSLSFCRQHGCSIILHSNCASKISQKKICHFNTRLKLRLHMICCIILHGMIDLDFGLLSRTAFQHHPYSCRIGPAHHQLLSRWQRHRRSGWSLRQAPRHALRGHEIARGVGGGRRMVRQGAHQELQLLDEVLTCRWCRWIRWIEGSVPQ